MDDHFFSMPDLYFNVSMVSAVSMYFVYTMNASALQLLWSHKLKMKRLKLVYFNQTGISGIRYHYQYKNQPKISFEKFAGTFNILLVFFYVLTGNIVLDIFYLFSISKIKIVISQVYM